MTKDTEVGDKLFEEYVKNYTPENNIEPEFEPEILDIKFFGANDLYAGGMRVFWKGDIYNLKETVFYKTFDGKLEIDSKGFDPGSRKFSRKVYDKAFKKFKVES